MKTLLLILMLVSGNVFADVDGYYHPNGEKNIIGERQQEVVVIGRSEKDRLGGCKQVGFHVAAYINKEGTATVHTFCGPGKPEVKKFTILVEEGI
jgi:hypothetical protein